MLWLRRYGAGVLPVLGFVAWAGATPVISTSTPYNGVTWFDVTDTVPRNIHYELVQIDTKAAGISFGVTPSNGATAGEVNASTTKNYVTSTGAAFGINAGYFTPVGSATPSLVSLEVSAGEPVSGWIGGNDTRSSGINISATNVVSFFTPVSYNVTDYSSNPALTLYNAIGSNYMSVKNNVKTGIVDDGAANARTSIGVKGQYLYLFTVDNSSTNSTGLSPVEVGTLLHDTWGLTNVLNLDGGGSTQMAMKTTKGVTYIDTPESASSPRAVAGNFVVYATAVAASVVNTLDNFDGGVGHFYSPVGSSGSNSNVAATSTAGAVTSEHHSGASSMKLTVNDSSATAGFLLRYWSGGAAATGNTVVASTGSIGFWLKTTTANLQASIDIRDGSGLESGTYRNIIADGQWHEYQWSMTDAAQWDSFSGGNGQIDAAGVTVDSLFFKSTTAENATIYMDDLQWTMSGAIPVPEPGLMSLAALSGTLLLARRRR